VKEKEDHPEGSDAASSTDKSASSPSELGEKAKSKTANGAAELHSKAD